MTQAAYLANATEGEVRGTSRRWADVDDLPLETLVSTGVIGPVTLLGALAMAGV